MTLVFPTLIFIPYSLHFLSNLSNIFCTFSLLSSISTISSANRTQQIFLPPMLLPSFSRNSFIISSSYMLNKVGDRQHPCLTPFPILIYFVCLFPVLTITSCSLYSFSISLLSLQSTFFIFKISNNFLQFTLSNAFSISIKHIFIAFPLSIYLSPIVLTTPIASLVPLPLLNPYCSSPAFSSIFLPKRLLSILNIIFAA